MDSYMRKHYNPTKPHISLDFPKLDEALLYYGVMKEYSFGNAKALLFNSCEAFKLIRYILRKNPEIIVMVRFQSQIGLIIKKLALIC